MSAHNKPRPLSDGQAEIVKVLHSASALGLKSTEINRRIHWPKVGDDYKLRRHMRGTRAMLRGLESRGLLKRGEWDSYTLTDTGREEAQRLRFG